MKKLLTKWHTLPLLLIILSGCVSRTATGEPTGWVWDLLGRPMEQFIFFCASLFQNSTGSYALGIIVVTIIVRLLISPLHIKMMNANIESQERMAYIKPQMDRLNQASKAASSPEEQMKIRQDILALQQAAGVKLISTSGCLPIFIQLPIFSALYFAATSSTIILNDVFLGIPLNTPSNILLVSSSLIYFVQALISQIGLTPEQKQMQRSMLWMSPALNAVIAISMPAGATLYWTVGGIFSCFTSAYTSLVQKPRIKEKVRAEMEKNPVQFDSRFLKDVTPQAESTKYVTSTPTKQRRNEGKQNKK